MLKTILAVSVVAAGLSWGLPNAGQARSTLSYEQAQERCIARIERYAFDGAGPSGRERSAYEIRSKYLRCFYGFTGQNPQTVPEFDRSNQTLRLFKRGSN